METRDFAQRLNRLSKNVLKPLISALGLKKRTEEVLLLRYIEELTVWDLSDRLGITYDSVNNLLTASRKEMLEAMENDYKILPKEIQLLIDRVLV